MPAPPKTRKKAPPVENNTGLDAVFNDPWPEGLDSTPKRSVLPPFLFALLLSAVLAGQYLWFFERDRVLQHPQARPLLEQACAWVSAWRLCRLPQTQDLSRIQVTRRFVSKHDTVPGAMLAHIIFENAAEFPQPYPLLELTFHNDHKQVVAVRRFTPAQYLDDPDRAAAPMPSGQAVHVKLEFYETVAAMHTYGFTIEFYRFSTMAEKISGDNGF